MQAYTEILPPTGVTSAVKLSFLGPKTHDLIVAKTSLLQIFQTRVIECPLDVEKDQIVSPVSGKPSEARNTESQMKLVLVGEYHLSGIITSLGAIKALSTKSGGQALLISFKDAKLSLVEWDPESHGLSTISIHFYESDDLQGSPWGPDLGKCPTFLTIDPSSRCAALKFGQRNLAIIPFRQAGDDLTLDEDYDPELDGVRPQSHGQTNGKNGATEAKQTPYASSFVLPLTALDPNLLHPIDIAFLYEYREPTLGVLSSAKYPSSYLNPERKDALSYTVFTLDLDQRARTPLLSVSSLPYDLYKLVPLPLPVGGTLLLGGNEIIHIDQSGKTNAVAVNEFAKQCSSFSMVDQSDLALKLEGCAVEQVNRATGELLIVLSTGDLAVLAFRVDGRSVSGLTVRRVSNDRGGNVLVAAASCAVAVGNGSLFIGSQYADSVILRCRQKGSNLSRKRSHAEMLGLDEVDLEEDEEDDDDEDDLYGGDTVPNPQLASVASSNGATDELLFTIQDTLTTLSPSGDPALGCSRRSDPNANQGVAALDLVLPVGSGRGGGIAFLNREIQPNVVQSVGIDHATDLWAVKASREVGSNSATVSKNGTIVAQDEYDQFLITSGMHDGKETSAIYTITDSGLEQRSDTDFEMDTTTSNVGVLLGGSRVVQVSFAEIRCYDQDLGLAQIIPMVDEATDTELKILHSSFADPYLLVLRDDFSVAILKAEKNGDVEEMEKQDALSATKWTSGCLYKSTQPDAGTLAYLLSVDGGLHVFDMANMTTPVYIAENLRNLPFILSSEQSHRRTGTADSLAEIFACDLGDSTATSLYLIARTVANEICIYEPFHYPKVGSNQPFSENLRWRKISMVPTRQSTDGAIETQLRPLRRGEVGECKVVLCPGEDTFCILKEAKSLPRLMKMRLEAVSALNAIHCEMCHKGLVVVDQMGSINLCQFPPGVQYAQTGWGFQRLDLGEEVEGLAYHQETGLYVIAINSASEFTLPEDEWHQEWATEDLSFKPETHRGMLKLFDPKSRSIIHEIQLEHDETILCIKSMHLEVSEKTHERRTLIAVGTGSIRGEDYPSNGSISIFDVIAVVPEVDRPETSKALKLVVREETKGAVTAISDIGNEGFLFHSQGQKCMVRGLKEDDSLLPVAFMDMQCYVTGLKSVKGTGLTLMADALKGIWFAGFLNDPYALKLFGKSATDMEVVVGDFLPWNKQLFMLVADADCFLHVLEFNPENPKSLSGQRLLPKSSFYAGHFTTSMTLLPSTTPPISSTMPDGDTDMEHDELPGPPPQILLSAQSGTLALVTQLDEQTYRRLGALQTYLTGILDHACGLNPRAHRAVESEGFGGRGILDGQILMRWNELGNQRKAEACSRVGAEIWQLKADINFISGGGLEYL